LLVSDNNIKKESYLEDINNILNTGEVPNLMAFEDLEEIFSEMRIIVKERGIFESRENMQRLFV
jgi:dynein heavy chain